MIPFLHGVIGTAGAAAGAFESIATVTASGGETALTFSSVPQGYVSLQIRCFSRETWTVAASVQIRMRFNGDAGNTYSFHEVKGNGSSASVQGQASYSNMYCGVSTTANTTASTYGASIIDIHGYASTTRNKTISAFGGGDTGVSSTEYWCAKHTGAWYNTSPVTSITLLPINGFAAGSIFSLYGVKGA